jgi:hypothetical protein
MVSFPIVDLTDELNVGRIHALADALGMARDAFPGYLIDTAVRRLTSAWVDQGGDVDATDSRYAHALDTLADALGMVRDDDPANLIEEAARRLNAGQIIPADEAIDLPTGTVIIRVDPVTGEPFPLDRTNGAPFRVGETGASLAVGEHVAYRVLLRGQGEPAHQPGDVITGEQVPDLPAGTRYALADEDGDPAPYGIVLAARDDYLPSVVMRGSRYVILTVPA